MPQAVTTMVEERSRELPLDLRADFAPTTLDDKARTVEVVLSTGAPVVRTDFWTGKRWIEELSLDPQHVRLERLNNGSPLLDSHYGWSVRDQLGVIVPGSARIAETNGKRELRALVRFSEKPSADEVWRDVKAGIVTRCSIGYRIHSKTLVEERDGEPPRYRCDDWEPYEGSMVSMPADQFAGTRSEQGRAGQPALEPNPCVLKRAATPMPEALDEKPKSATNDEAIRAAADKAAREAREAATRAEQQRQTEARKLFVKFKVPEKRQTELLGEGTDGKFRTLDEIRTALVDEFVRDEEKTDTRGAHTGVSVGETEQTKLRSVITDGLLMRAGVPLIDDAGKSRQAADGAVQFAGQRLVRIAEFCLRRQGVDTSRMSDIDIIERSIAPGHGEGDFPKIAANVAHLSLRTGYTESPRTFQPFVRPRPMPDFKPSSSVTLSTAPDLKKIAANGEITYATMAENGQTWKIASYAIAFGLTRVMLINDSADAFSKLPYMFGASGARLESDIVYALITTGDGQVLDEDGLALFHANHLNTGTGVIDITGLNSGYTAMSVQRSPARSGQTGALLNLTPRYLLVPTTRFTTAQQFTASITPNVQSSVNPFGPGGGVPLIPIAEPRLNADSSAEWYLVAQPGQIDTIEVGTLAGREGLYMEQRIGFERDGLEFKARHDFGAAAIDFRGFYRSTGS